MTEMKDQLKHKRPFSRQCVRSPNRECVTLKRAFMPFMGSTNCFSTRPLQTRRLEGCSLSCLFEYVLISQYTGTLRVIFLQFIERVGNFIKCKRNLHDKLGQLDFNRVSLRKIWRGAGVWLEQCRGSGV